MLCPAKVLGNLLLPSSARCLPSTPGRFASPLGRKDKTAAKLITLSLKRRITHCHPRREQVEGTHADAQPVLATLDSNTKRNAVEFVCNEPPRVCRRPQLLRDWGYGSEEEDIEQIFI
jgi:hypothetical protein